MPDTKNIATKMAAAMKEIDAVTKGGRNDIQKYNYVRAADVANEVRKALVKQGISFSYSVQDERYWDAPTKSGGVQFYCSLKVEGTFFDSESGESITSTAMGWGADSQDKAPYKAMTGALKYLLRMTFLIPDEQDPEKDEPEETAPRAPRPKLITKVQADSLRELVKKRGLTTEMVLGGLKEFGLKNFGEVEVDRFDEIKSFFEGV